ncbi:MAG: hypothetical protein KBB95_24110 [Deltaproteobacteria bacterium]|nr:hypothetical protein [Deltaproteobacteria bacterium]
MLERNRKLERGLMGQQRERTTSEGQLTLDVLSAVLGERDAAAIDALQTPDDPKDKTPRKKGHGRRPLPEELPRVHAELQLAQAMAAGRRGLVRREPPTRRHRAGNPSQHDEVTARAELHRAGPDVAVLQHHGAALLGFDAAALATTERAAHEGGHSAVAYARGDVAGDPRGASVRAAHREEGRPLHVHAGHRPIVAWVGGVEARLGHALGHGHAPRFGQHAHGLRRVGPPLEQRARAAHHQHAVVLDQSAVRLCAAAVAGAQRPGHEARVVEAQHTHHVGARVDRVQPVGLRAGDTTRYWAEDAVRIRRAHELTVVGQRGAA